MPLKLKLDADGHVVVQDGNPVYVHPDGKELPFDADATVGTIDRITSESKSYKTRAQAAEEKLTKFDGIDDPLAAKKALDTVKNLDDQKLIAAGEVEKIKTAAIASVEEKYKPIVEERDRLKGELHGEKIGGSFARSKFIADKIAVPADIVESRFGRNFKLEDGKVVAYDQAGNAIFSKKNHGSHADFDEALEILVDAYPHKDSILKGTGGSGTGKKPGEGGAGTGGADLSKLSPVERMNAARAAQATH